MGLKSGIALKSLQWVFRAVQFCSSAIVLGIYSYYLATLSNHALPISGYLRSVEGISGASALYTGASLILLWCLGGFRWFAFLAIILDVAFVGAFAYIAWETRHGVTSCTGQVETPFGNGDANSKPPGGKGGVTALPDLGSVCTLEKVSFAVSIVAIGFFLLSAFAEILLWKHHKREKRFGPSPANNYTTGSAPVKWKFWKLGNKRKEANAGLDMNPPYEPPVFPLSGKPGNTYVNEANPGGTGGYAYSRTGKADYAKEQGLYAQQASGVAGTPGQY
ncbi:hypothetical protein VC83_01594 [Pseudogymnoascus destructans]|uniref:MARVEL domain-containing protein n=2 Tax=Pseudogymnoascus destructans TaxID=655981 RepID=L8G462_PSED2|nr:uncharacterized protein VC83_01594 [Pseudogymnoascus destructans]ELR08065.1 hypothetical protein GMDG_02892 [Pseudogymnoascus destructans 20631-21]OAF62165.1 hypothetical protein VC83_01594 [Pseudogymnoascus destructans]